MDPERVAASAPFRLLGQLDLGDQAAGRRIPPGELDAGCFTDQTASSVAVADLIRRILGPCMAVRSWRGRVLSADTRSDFAVARLTL